MPGTVGRSGGSLRRTGGLRPNTAGKYGPWSAVQPYCTGVRWRMPRMRVGNGWSSWDCGLRHIDALSLVAKCTHRPTGKFEAFGRLRAGLGPAEPVAGVRTGNRHGRGPVLDVRTSTLGISLPIGQFVRTDHRHTLSERPNLVWMGIRGAHLLSGVLVGETDGVCNFNYEVADIS
ncbi:hypothetical protein C8Q78DRAFT_1099911 [Trametes maxima]|nr:hypothetical protein C8Q78DRAFT_1099911 [Trametes maxima]